MTDTNAMIRCLAREAGARSESRCAGTEFGRTLLGASLIAFVLALGLVLLVGGRDVDWDTVLRSDPFHYKAGVMILLASGAFVVVRHEGVPGSSRWAALALLPGMAALLVGAIVDTSGFPLFGRDAASVPICFLSILALSLPALAIMLRTLKGAVVTRPTLAGVSSGLLAGALGACAYAVACKNDGALFVLVWYGLAIGTVCLLGAAAGRRYLRW
ncbi:DUF1109 domain-containing protein [Chelatococcus sp. GCM10030263]|uniref:DUF1109 domain-containing protein n=1 Tax=Chelatococcus sp. GCM10030263 TaxID=3273387 RepID=UPI00362161AB